VKVFGKLIGGFMLIVAARRGFSYFSVFPPHLGPEEAVLFFILQSIFILMLVVLFVLPTVTTALTLNAMRRTGQLRLLIGLALVSALPVGLAYQFAVKPPLSFISAQLLDERLGKESFRQELGQSASMFLAYWGNHLGELDKTLGDQIEVHQELTKKWQRLASGLVVKDEANAFRVLAWKEPGGETWLGIGLWNSPSEPMTQLLVAARAGGKVFTRWSELPAPVQQRFQFSKERNRQPFEVLQQKLLDDIRSSGLSSPRPERAAPK
jgi:hypothetical protein